MTKHCQVNVNVGGNDRAAFDILFADVLARLSEQKLCLQLRDMRIMSKYILKCLNKLDISGFFLKKRGGGVSPPTDLKEEDSYFEGENRIRICECSPLNYNFQRQDALPSNSQPALLASQVSLGQRCCTSEASIGHRFLFYFYFFNIL